MSDLLKKWREDNAKNGIVAKSPQINPILRFREKQTAHRAIKAKCAQCVGCSDDWIEPGFRNEIKNCTDSSCALFDYRPYQARVDENA